MLQIVWTASPAGSLESVNHALARYTGRSVEELTGTGFRDFIHPEDLALSAQHWARSIETGEPYEVEHRLRSARGEYRWFLVRAVPMKDAAGQIVKWFGSSTDIEVLKNTQRELAESEERFRAAQELSLQGFAIFRAVRDGGQIIDFNWVYRNRAAVGFAVAEGELVGRRLLEVMPETRDDVLGRYIRVTESGVAERFAMQSATSGRWFSICVGRLGDGVAVSYDEVTAQKKVEQERARRAGAESQARKLVEEQRRQLQQLLTNAPVAIAVLRGLPLVYEMANPAHCALAGKPELVGRIGREVLPELAGQGVWDLLENVVRTGTPFVGKEFPAEVIRDGKLERAYLNFIAEPTRDSSGNIDGLVTIAADVTELVSARMKAEQFAANVEQQQKWLETVLDQLPMPFVLIEPGTARVMFANRAADELAGGSFPLAESEGRHAASFVLTDAAGNSLPADQMPGVRVARGETLRGEEVTWHTSSGVHPVVVHSAQIPAVYGHPSTIVLGFVEVTRLKEIENKLHEAVKVRDEFLSIASHELKTPLTAFMLLLASLKRAVGDNPEALVRAERAIASTRRLGSLVDRLLDVSRISAGRLQLEPEPLDFAEVVREVATRFQDGAAAQIKLELQGPLWGIWDRLGLEQVATNLISNAVKYGEGRPIAVKVMGTGHMVRLSVQDHGIGIERRKQARLFERFERAVSSRNFGGFGLGLWIARQMVEAHGGSISLESDAGLGATFTVELPARPTSIGAAVLDC
jgi:PAS domain S-box-containing protein